MKAVNAAEKVSVLVTTVAVRQKNAQAPTGNGLSMRPEMVVKKMASRDQALWVTA